MQNIRIKLDEIKNKDFTYHEVGVDQTKINFDEYSQKVLEECIKKTSNNLNIKFDINTKIVCKSCVFNTQMPGIYLYSDGRCNMCHSYEEALNKAEKKGTLQKELDDCLSVNTEGNIDVIVGLSGGKDSSSVLSYLAFETNLRVEAVLVDNGYIPDFVIENCQIMCDNAKVKFTVLRFDLKPDIDKILNNIEIKEYPCDKCTQTFKKLITNYAEQINVSKVILGRNFWSRIEPELTAVNQNKAIKGSIINFYYLPFLLHWKKKDIFTRLEKIQWRMTETDIEGLSTNCLVPGLVENRVLNKTGIHPETTLLAEEVIVGFISREEALEELEKHN